MMLIFLRAESMEVIVDSLTILPLTIKTPILEIEADYGNPMVDWLMIVSIVAIIYIVKKVVDKWKK